MRYDTYINSLNPMELQNFKDIVKLKYQDEYMSAQDVADMLGVGLNIVRREIQKCGYKKDKKLMYENRVKKAQATNLKKYGTVCTLNTEESIQKKKETWINKYGVDNPSKSDVIKDKKKETVLEHFGVNCPFQSEEVKEKIFATNFERYGGKTSLSSKEILSKVKKTNLERYGVENTFQLKHSKESALKSIKGKVPKEVADIVYNKENFEKFLSKFEGKDRTTYNMYSELNYDSDLFLRQYHKFGLENKYPIYSNGSHYEDEIFEYVNSLYGGDIVRNTRKQISPYEIDIYIPSKRLGIEFNGDFWHCDKQKEKNYHKIKSNTAKKNGIFLYNIWEYEWNDKRKQSIIKSQIKHLLGCDKDIIFARKCKVEEVDSKTARSFLNENHLQGFVGGSNYLGLFYNNNLVSIMTFGKPRFGDRDSIELLRFCNKLETSVVGGASKLFNNYCKRHKGEKIISFCNISKGSGNLYETLGFDLVAETECNYVWLHRSGDMLTRYETQMKNEDSIMREKGYLKLYDCGNYKYEYLNY